MRDVNIAGLLERSAERRGPAACIVSPEGRQLWTFDALTEASARLAGGLVDLGIRPGDRVLVLESNVGELFMILVSVIWAGATATLPPLSLPLHRALRVAAAARPTAVIAPLPIWPVALMMAGLRSAPLRLTSRRWRFPGTVSLEALARHRPVAPSLVADDSPAIVSFTTGSTGVAKPIIRTHGVLRAQHDALSALRHLDETEVDLAGLPMLVLHNLGSGVTSVPAPRGAGTPTFGSRVRSALATTGARSAAGFPHLFESALGGARPGELGRLRSIYLGGTRVRVALLAGLKVAAPGARATVVYGSTEVEPIAAIGADDYVNALAAHEPAAGVCVGSVLAGLELRLASSTLGARGTRLPATVGQILVRGARAAGGTGGEGWVETGDLGRVGDDGRLWLLGRSSNAVGDVLPLEVERLIEDLPWVDRAAFVGLDSGSVARGLLAVQPLRWGESGDRAAWLSDLSEVTRGRGWPIDDIVLQRRLPVVVGAAAKVDEERLRMQALARRRTQSPRTTLA